MAMKFRPLSAATWLLVALCSAGLLLAAPACGGKGDAEAAGVDGEIGGEPSSQEPPPEPKAASLVRSESEPVTLQVLRLQPEGAAVAGALPPITALFEKLRSLGHRMAPADMNADEDLQRIARELGEKWGVQGEDIPAVFQAKGIDPSRPLALFVDMADAGPMMREFGRTVGQLISQAQAVDQASQPAPDAAPDAATPPPVDPTILQAQAMAFLLSLKTAAVVPLTSADAADRIAADITDEPAQQVETAGVTVNTYMSPVPWGYFVRDDWMVMSNSIPMLGQVANRFDQPADVRYGSPSCPAENRDDLVQLARLDQLMPMLADMLQGMGDVDPMMGALLQLQANALQELRETYQSPDPLVTTMAWREDGVELVSRLDTREFPKLLEQQGEPIALRHAAMLPAATAAAWSMQLTPEAKVAFENQWLSSVTPDMQQDPNVQQGLGTLRLLMGLLGREVTVAVESVDGVLNVSALFDLENAEVTKNLLAAMLGLPLQSGELHNGVAIMESTAQLPTGGSLFFAFPEGIGLMATSADRLKGLLDSLNQGASGGLVSSLDPPLDTSIPRYTMLVIRDALISDVVTPLLGSQGPIEPETARTLQGVVDRLRDLRMSSELTDGWMTSRMAVTFD